MIYSVTLNPSLDYIMGVSGYKSGATNRTDYEIITAGGKGINVSEVLRNLGYKVKDLVFTAGFAGREIERILTEKNVDAEFLRIDGCNRINVKIKGKEETEINGRGAPIGEDGTATLLGALDALKSGDVLVLSGNAARGTVDDIYERVLRRAAEAGAVSTVDAHGKLFGATLKYRPILVKPNLDELCDFFGREIALGEVAAYAKKLQEYGARNVIVSLGKDGALTVTESGETLTAKPPEGTLVNSTGAGDSMVAGYIAAMQRGLSESDRFRFAVAAGTACAYGMGFPGKEETESMAQRVDVVRLRD